jgi:hypothetical protein
MCIALEAIAQVVRGDWNVREDGFRVTIVFFIIPRVAQLLESLIPCRLARNRLKRRAAPIASASSKWARRTVSVLITNRAGRTISALVTGDVFFEEILCDIRSLVRSFQAFDEGLVCGCS